MAVSKWRVLGAVAMALGLGAAGWRLANPPRELRLPEETVRRVLEAAVPLEGRKGAAAWSAKTLEAVWEEPGGGRAGAWRLTVPVEVAVGDARIVVRRTASARPVVRDGAVRLAYETAYTAMGAEATAAYGALPPEGRAAVMAVFGARPMEGMSREEWLRAALEPDPTLAENTFDAAVRQGVESVPLFRLDADAAPFAGRAAAVAAAKEGGEIVLRADPLAALLDRCRTEADRVLAAFGGAGGR